MTRVAGVSGGIYDGLAIRPRKVAAPVQVVLATDAFASIGGSETYLLTVAEQLQRLGHGVTIHANRLGQMSDLAIARGLAIAPELEDLPSHCDVVLSQDGGMAYALAERYPQTPHVYVAHSVIFDFQMPPLVPGVVGAVVVMSERVEMRVRALDVPHEILRLRQPIDTERLVPRGAPRERPERALLLGNYLQGDARQVLVDTWAAAGVEVVQVGQPAGSSLQPEDDIEAADIVVGKGRALLDAMACGRPAYLYDAWGTDGWMTPESYLLMEAGAFAGESLPKVVDRDGLRRDLEAYDPLMGQVNRNLVMNNHQARIHAEELVALFQRLAPGAAPAGTPHRELARLVRRRWQAELELFVLRRDFGSVRQDLTAQIDEIRRSYEEKFVAAQAEYEEAKARYELASASSREDYERGLTTVREQYDQAIAEVMKDHEQSLAAAGDRHKLELEAAAVRADEQIQELQAQPGVRLGLALGRLASRFRRR
jgi:hypothetical protein